MNKKVNTFIFLLIGTIVNIALMLILLIALLYLIGLIFTADSNSQLVTAITLSAVMLSVVGSYLIYSRLIKIINKKWNLENYIEPLFRRKR